MHSFDTPEPISVDVELGVGNIHITASDRPDAAVEVRATDAKRKADVAAAEQTKVDFADGTLFVKAPKSWRQWTPWGGHESIDVRIEVPTGSHVRGSAGVVGLRCNGRVGECRFKAGVGNVRIDACGPVDLATGSGDIDISRVEGDVELKTSSGDVKIGTIDGSASIKNSNGDTSIHDITRDLRVTAANGDVVVERARAAVVLKSANGDLRLDEAERGTIVAETARGNVEVGIRHGIAAWLDLTTAFGRVRSDLDAAAPPARGADALEVRARTAYGDITIRRAITDENDEAST
jgi:hypothetical protein